MLWYNRSLRLCICNRLAGNADASSPQTTACTAKLSGLNTQEVWYPGEKFCGAVSALQKWPQDNEVFCGVFFYLLSQPLYLFNSPNSQEMKGCSLFDNYPASSPSSANSFSILSDVMGAGTCPSTTHDPARLIRASLLKYESLIQAQNREQLEFSFQPRQLGENFEHFLLPKTSGDSRCWWFQAWVLQLPFALVYSPISFQEILFLALISQSHSVA